MKDHLSSVVLNISNIFIDNERKRKNFRSSNSQKLWSGVLCLLMALKGKLHFEEKSIKSNTRRLVTAFITRIGIKT